MKMRRLDPCVGIVLLLSCTVGCSDTPFSPALDAGHDAAISDDAAVDEAVDAEGEPDAAVSSDTGDSGGAFEQAVLIPDDYVCADGASSTFYPGVSAPFVKPDRFGGGPRTRQVLVDGFGGSLPEVGVFLAGAPHLEPGGRIPRSLFAERGEDVLLLHFGFVTNRASLEDVFLSLTVLVDYQPVEARYTVWNDTRTLPRGGRTSAGLHWPVTGDTTLVDILIPASAFPEDRRYDISLFRKTTGGGLGSDSERMALYYNGFGGASHPCMKPVEPQPMTAFEEALARLALPSTVIAYPEGMTEPEGLLRPVRVKAGEELTITATGTPELTHDAFSEEAWVPLLDGEPVGATWFLAKPSASGVATFRTEITVSAPEEPGLHTFVVAKFTDPFLPPEDHTGERVDGVEPGRSWSASSTIILEVPD